MSYKPGDYLCICDICGFEGLRSEMVKTWDNWLVHRSTCYEPKHPQYTPPRSKHEKQKVVDYRPEKPYTFITTPVTGDDL